MSEFMPTNGDITTRNESIATDPMTQADAAKQSMINGDAKKKKRGGFGILKAALLIMRKSNSITPRENKEKNKSLRKQKSNDTSTKTKWAKLVGSMRPLHMQETANSPPRPVAEQLPQQQHHQQQEEVITIAPASPAPSSSCGTISTYASANSLRELHSDNEEEEDPDQAFDSICEDEMIDAKAEEFIAQFYKQIQLQNSKAAHHRRHHHHRRY